MLTTVKIYNISQVINENDLQQMQLFTEYGQLVMEEHSTEKSFQVGPPSGSSHRRQQCSNCAVSVFFSA